MNTTKRLFITGCNRGIGHKFVELVARTHSDIDLHVTSRNPPDEFASQWNKLIPDHRLNCYQLDLASRASVAQTAASLVGRRIKFDFLIANAGRGFDIGTEIPSPELAQAYLKTNLDWTIDFIKHFLPVLDEHGRLIIVSSRYASFANQTEYMKNILRNPNITQEEILGLSQAYIEAAKKGQMGEFSWTAYGTSKALLNSWARFVLPNYLKPRQSYVVMHPGWCQTEMGGTQAPASAEDGAKQIYDTLWLKDIPPDMFYNEGFCSYQTCQ